MLSLRKIFRYLFAVVVITFFIVSLIQPKTFLTRHSSRTLLDPLAKSWREEAFSLNYSANKLVVLGRNQSIDVLISPTLQDEAKPDDGGGIKDPTCQCRMLRVSTEILVTGTYPKT